MVMCISQKKHGALTMDSKLEKEASKIKKKLDIMSKDKAGAKVINRLVGNKKQTYTIAADAIKPVKVC